MLLIGFVIAQVIIFAVIIFVLKKLIFQDTSSAINRLTQLDDMNRQKEKQLAVKLEETDKLLKQKRDELAEEEKKMKMESERAASQLYDDIVNKAKKEAEETVKKAIAARDKMKNDAMIAAEEKAIELCREMLVKVLSPAIDQAINDSLVKAFLGDLENADTSVISKTIDRAEIISAKPLGEELIKRSKEVLAKKLERPIEVKAQVDAALIGGVLMKFGTLVIDDTVSERLKEAAAVMKDGLSSKYKVI